MDDQPDNLMNRITRSLGGRGGIFASLSVWMVLLTVQCISVAKHPLERTVTTNYRVAADAFWHQKPMYSEGQHGWLYPPQGAVLYSVFSSIPSVEVGEVLWRIVSTGLFVWSLYRLAKLGAGSKKDEALQGLLFLAITLSSVALAAGCMRNGQMNLPLAGLFVLSCCELAERKWWRATLWLCLSLVAKPIALPLVLLSGLLFPALWWRLPIGLVLVALVPFVNPHWGYVVEQYQAAFHKMKAAGEPGAGVFSDIVGMMQVFPFVGPGKTAHFELPGLLATAMRGAAALLTLVLAYVALKRFPPALGCFFLLLFSVGYLMLFNPRTEGNSYVMFVPLVGVLFVWAMAEGKRLVAMALLVSVVLFAAAHELYKDKLDSVWIRPACAMVICLAAARRVAINRPPAKALFVA